MYQSPGSLPVHMPMLKGVTQTQHPTPRRSQDGTSSSRMAVPRSHAVDCGKTRQNEGHPYHIRGQSQVADDYDFLNPREASRAPSERSTHFDISEHDFLSARGPPSQRSTMGYDIAATGGGAQRKTHVPRKLILCFDGTGNKFHGDDSDSNILKIFRMLDRTANDQCE